MSAENILELKSSAEKKAVAVLDWVIQNTYDASFTKLSPLSGVACTLFIVDEIIYGVDDEGEEKTKRQIEMVDFWLEVRMALMKINDTLVSLLPDKEQEAWDTFYEYYERMS